jgi:multidrug efflux pump
MIEFAISRSRTVLSIFVLILIAGAYSYTAIPREAAPDIPIPVIYVSMNHTGISPEDAVDQLVKPMEQELKAIEGVDEMEATAYEGGANIVMRFQAGFDNKKALDDVRAKVDIAKAELPKGDEAEEPRISEVNFSLFPVVTIVLSGDVNERLMKTIAEDLQDELESIPGVLEAPIKGLREEQLLVEIDRLKFENYGLTAADVVGVINANNLLVAAGSLEVEQGKYAIKVPGLITGPQEILDLPLKTFGDRIVRVRDVADVKATFKDREILSRVNGEPAIVINVSKRIGENVIATVNKVKDRLKEVSEGWPAAVKYRTIADESLNIEERVNGLQNNVIMAVILVMIVVLTALGPRPSFLVATAVPGSFLAAVIMLHIMGISLNIVVLFALILAVGMLVDGAIVVTELAETQRQKGKSRAEAFAYAANYMAWPIIASTATTLAAFLPLLFWPGIPGQFMKFLPITLMFTLAASLAMALIFLPTIGAQLPGGKSAATPTGGPFADFYEKILIWALDRPLKILGAVVAAFIGSVILYGAFGKGVEFFPDIEAERANILIHANGDYSFKEKDSVLQQVEQRMKGLEGIDTYQIITGAAPGQETGPSDVIGHVAIEFEKWSKRGPRGLYADDILAEALARMRDIHGVTIEEQKERGGPQQGKPIRLVVTANNYALIPPVVDELKKELAKIPGTVNIDDNLPDPGIEWALEIDRLKAARSGTNLAEVGTAIRLATAGAVVGTYRPVTSKDEVDIVARFKPEQRSLSTIDDLRVSTPGGLAPISNFTEREAQQKVTVLRRLDQKNAAYVESDVKKGVLADDIVQIIKAELKDRTFPNGVRVTFKGDDEEQKESAAFLQSAFTVALFMMAIILVTQFNSFYQAFIILSAVIFSTTGVFLGHLVINQAFSVIMSGTGVIALAGVVVNNNIVLIDTFNKLLKDMPWREALIETGKSRLRPVMLTAITTVVGLLPMATKVGVDLIARTVDIDSPSSQWWFQLSNSIIFGLSLATILTLIVTPCMIAIGQRRTDKKKVR